MDLTTIEPIDHRLKSMKLNKTFFFNLFLLGIYHRGKRLTVIANESKDTIIAKFSELFVPQQPLHW